MKSIIFSMKSIIFSMKPIIFSMKSIIFSMKVSTFTPLLLCFALHSITFHRSISTFTPLILLSDSNFTLILLCFYSAMFPSLFTGTADSQGLDRFSVRISYKVYIN